MTHTAKRSLILIGLAAGVGVGWWWMVRDHEPEQEPVSEEQLAFEEPGLLSPLAMEPDWSRLDAYQGQVGRDRFVSLLDEVFTTGEEWRQWLQVRDDRLWVSTRDDGAYELEFSVDGRWGVGNRYWRSAAEMPVAPVGLPLDGLRVAIDPGHLGGVWAKMEERHLVVDNLPPVCEGNMTLQVAFLLRERLETLGAEVHLVREDSNPLTPLRPADLLGLAEQTLRRRMGAIEGFDGVLDPVQVERLSEQLFYRTAEIRARARRVNQEIMPDVVLCVHFNAESWGNPEAGSLCGHHHCHVLVNGAYSDAELAHEDQRFWLVRKLATGVHDEEVGLAGEVSGVFAAVTGMPAFRYPDGATNVRPADDEGFVWARNLLANRVYDCPVVFLEPYVMNSVPDHPRMIAGDYDGLREVGGKMQPSIFREYAEVVVAAMVRYYNARRGGQ